MELYCLRSRPDYIRKAVWKRDRGICAICGVDADAAYREWVSIRNEVRRMAMWLSSPIRCVRWCCRSCQWVRDPEAPSSHSREFRQERDQYERHLLAKWGPEQQWTTSRKSGWDADHIIPIVEGGADLGLDNFRTLCHPCHKAETRKLRARMKARGA